ncbi:hypothetical protein [Oscillatoria sp. HE19RPO]|uniref:hypothetical protein n=1 Tax=Oscillatoria sp. HE19RPO TaxID=2954806 RepID=UPI0020C51AB5|nr:hypothetical protein [Oscillatoria sp. HE19RPO]
MRSCIYNVQENSSQPSSGKRFFIESTLLLALTRCTPPDRTTAIASFNRFPLTT